MAALTLVSFVLVFRLPNPHDSRPHHHFLWVRHGRRTGLAHALYLLTGGHAVGRRLGHWFHHHEGKH
jgi:hypothetical protein